MYQNDNQQFSLGQGGRRLLNQFGTKRREMTLLNQLGQQKGRQVIHSPRPVFSLCPSVHGRVLYTPVICKTPRDFLPTLPSLSSSLSRHNKIQKSTSNTPTTKKTQKILQALTNPKYSDLRFCLKRFMHALSISFTDRDICTLAHTHSYAPSPSLF